MSKLCSECGAVSVWMCSLHRCPQKNQLDDIRSKYRDMMGKSRTIEEKEENVERQQKAS
jgi:hypothetical protein